MSKTSLYIALCTTTILFSASVAFAAPVVAAPTETKNDFVKALTEGKILADIRYRYEFVDQDGLAHDANAHTIRTRLGYETGKFYGFSVLAEVENISSIGSERYNDTANGRTTYPTVADPQDTNLNRLQLSYSGVPDTNITAGRQLINLDNQRFVGGVSWRQNDQTFDAVSVKNTSIKDTTLFYAYSNQVNRIYGTQASTSGANNGIWNKANIHLINASYAGLPFGKITGYSYLLDIPDSPTLSTKTFGARFEGKHKLGGDFTGLLNLEYARQSDYADNTANYNLDYYSIEPAVTYGQFTLKGQYESIKGNGTQAVQFALGTNHAFDGWVDKFLTTPVNGLVDANVGLTYTAKSENKWLNGTKATVVYHDFSAERGNTNYGTEWDGVVEQTFAKYYTVGIKAGSYNADKLYTDTVKIMPYVQFKF
jgi:hypothetical protein